MVAPPSSGSSDEPQSLVPNPARPGWRGDEHQVQLAAAKEVGLSVDDTALDYYTQGFRDAMTLEDPRDHAIVLRGRTVLRASELERALIPAWRYLSVDRNGVRVRVSHGEFEIRVAARVAETSRPAYGNAKIALQLWVGFGLLGLTVFMLWPTAKFAAGILWGVGLVVGGLILRRGVASGRAMLGAHLAVALAMLAREEQLILPLAGEEAS